MWRNQLSYKGVKIFSSQKVSVSYFSTAFRLFSNCMIFHFLNLEPLWYFENRIGGKLIKYAEFCHVFMERCHNRSIYNKFFEILYCRIRNGSTKIIKLKRFVSWEKISSSLKIMRNGKTDQTVRMVVNIRPRFDRFDTNRCIAVSLELIE